MGQRYGWDEENQTDWGPDPDEMRRRMLSRLPPGPDTAERFKARAIRRARWAMKIREWREQKLNMIDVCALIVFFTWPIWGLGLLFVLPPYGAESHWPAVCAWLLVFFGTPFICAKILIRRKPQPKDY